VILHWQGTSWTEVSSGTLSDLNAVWGAAANDIWAVGATGAIQRWNGTRWSTMTATTMYPASWTGVWGSAASDVWLMSSVGDTLHWNGTTFTETITSNIGVWGRSSGEVYGWGRNMVTRWNGSTWVDLKLPNPNNRLGLEMSLNAGPTGDIWVVADSEVLRWNGSTWSGPERLIFGYLTSVFVTGSDVWAAGGHNQVLRRALP
jgi:hypothetical protein